MGTKTMRPNSSDGGTTPETYTSKREDENGFEKAFKEGAPRRTSSTGDRGQQEFNWLGDHANTLAELRLRRRRSSISKRGVNGLVLERLREALNNLQPSTDVRVQLLPLIGKPGIFRCANCYRTFSQKAALQHIEFCGRKASENGGISPNPLGRPVEVLSFGPFFKAKEYARAVSFAGAKKAPTSRRYSHCDGFPQQFKP
ncbi:hypothetical protein SprV_0802541400 [Sparganum proliferum]